MTIKYKAPDKHGALYLLCFFYAPRVLSRAPV